MVKSLRFNLDSYLKLKRKLDHRTHFNKKVRKKIEKC